MIILDNDEKKYYSRKEIINKVILGDAFKVLDKIEANIFDMVFFDAPYYLQIPSRKLKRWNKSNIESADMKWDKFVSFTDYDNFIRTLLIKFKRVMKPNATIWAIGTYHNIFRIGKIMQDLGFWILNNVIWFKTNPMPNWLNVRLTNATEELIWAVKNKDVKNYTYNLEYAKKFSFKDFKSKIPLNVWRFPICMGKERIKDENGKTLHPTQKPIELLKRIILLSTREGDLILDALAGTGTTGYVAKLLKRNYVMIEINQKYVVGIEKRMKQLNLHIDKFL